MRKLLERRIDPAERSSEIGQHFLRMKWRIRQQFPLAPFEHPREPSIHHLRPRCNARNRMIAQMFHRADLEIHKLRIAAGPHDLQYVSRSVRGIEPEVKIMR